MLPPSDELPDVLPTERLLANGKPVPELRAELRRIPNLLNAWSVVALWLSTIAIIAVAIWIDHPLAWLAAFVLMGPQFARFASLAHEAAHRLLFSNKRINDFVGRWVLGYPAFTSTDLYRRGHMAHHKDEFGPNEPDMNLYNGYPITGRVDAPQAAPRPVRQQRLEELEELVPRSALRRHAACTRCASSAARSCCSPIFLAAGWPQLYLFLWFLPWMTEWRVINRLGPIAEHGGMQRSNDRRLTTHTVRQSLLARFFMVPYNIGYHLAHHVDMGVPWRKLPEMHAELVEAGWITPSLEYPTYRALWRKLSSRPS